MVNALSDHHPKQVPGILIIIKPKQPNLPICSTVSTPLLFHLLTKPSLHLTANMILGIIIIATIIIYKCFDTKEFGSLYVLSCIVMFVLEFAIDFIDVSITGDPYSGIFDYILATLLFSLAPSFLVKIIRSMNS